MLERIYKEKILKNSELTDFLRTSEKPNHKIHFIDALLRHQLTYWKQLHDSYNELSQIKSKNVTIDGINFEVDFNPLRKINTTANINKKNIESRKCTLCPNNFYEGQRGVIVENFLVIPNARPIVANHLTFIYKHKPQCINNKIISQVLNVIREIYPYRILYHSAEAGASIPNHFHLQALPYKIPIETEFLERKVEKNLKKGGVFTLNFPSRALLVESSDAAEMNKTVSNILDEIKNLGYLDKEWRQHMVNIWTVYSEEKNKYRMFIIPRSKWRPHDYGLEEGKIACSPGTLEMCGKIIVANESTFNRMNEKLIRRILDEVSMKKDDFEELIRRLS